MKPGYEQETLLKSASRGLATDSEQLIALEVEPWMALTKIWVGRWASASRSE